MQEEEEEEEEIEETMQGEEEKKENDDILQEEEVENILQTHLVNPMKGCVWMKLVDANNEEFEVEEWDYSSSILLNNLPLNLEIEDLRNEIQDLVSNMFQNNPLPPFTLRFSFFIYLILEFYHLFFKKNRVGIRRFYNKDDQIEQNVAGFCCLEFDSIQKAEDFQDLFHQNERIIKKHQLFCDRMKSSGF